jgi:GH43 family beta-xylosidase
MKKDFKNPIIPFGADPWIIEKDGVFYYCHSTGNGVAVRSFKTFSEANSAISSTVYTAPAGTEYSAEYWAPELYYIEGNWYIYVAADNGDNFNHRMYVLKGTTQNPQAPFEMVGKITDPTDKWAIDGTILSKDGKNYFIWSGWEGDENVAQNIYIAEMESPTKIKGERVLISTPTEEWEKRGCVDGLPTINEGPVAITENGVTAIIYSASGSWCDDYCLGQLTFTGGDVMDRNNWKKESAPVFSKKEGCFGPGHCSFVRDQDGELWIIYHANLVSGTSWDGRSVHADKCTFKNGLLCVEQ